MSALGCFVCSLNGWYIITNRIKRPKNSILLHLSPPLILTQIFNAKVIQHLQLQLVEIRTAENETVERSTEINLTQLLQSSETDELIFLANTSQSHSKRIGSTNYSLSNSKHNPTSLSLLLLDLQQLVDSLIAGHEARREIDSTSFHQRLKVGLLHLDIYVVTTSLIEYVPRRQRVWSFMLKFCSIFS